MDLHSFSRIVHLMSSTWHMECFTDGSALVTLVAVYDYLSHRCFSCIWSLARQPGSQAFLLLHAGGVERDHPQMLQNSVPGLNTCSSLQSLPGQYHPPRNNWVWSEKFSRFSLLKGDALHWLQYWSFLSLEHTTCRMRDAYVVIPQCPQQLKGIFT